MSGFIDDRPLYGKTIAVYLLKNYSELYDHKHTYYYSRDSHASVPEKDKGKSTGQTQEILCQNTQSSQKHEASQKVIETIFIS